MLVALAVIVEVVAMRMQDVEVGLRSCEGDVEQSPFLFDLGVRFGGQIGRDVAIGRVQDEDRLPLQALGGVDRAEGEIVLVQIWIGGEVLGRAGWVQRHVVQELGAGLEPSGHPFDLFEVACSREGIVKLLL